MPAIVGVLQICLSVPPDEIFQCLVIVLQFLEGDDDFKIGAHRRRATTMLSKRMAVNFE